MRRYRSRLSGPLLDRIDLVVHVPAVDVGALGGGPCGECSAEVRRRVVRARRIQQRRFAGVRATCNGEMGSVELERWAAPSGEARRLLVSASRRMGLSARAYDRIRRVARTLADLEGVGEIRACDVAGAIPYRAVREEEG